MAKYIILFSLLVASSLASLPRPVRIDPRIDWRVVGGSNAPEGVYPHMISLRYFGSHSCGGSIINENWILTAAHCVVNTPESYLTVVTGSTKLNAGGDSYNVLEIHSHEDYDAWDIQQDIAVLKVDSITLKENVAPIVLGSEILGGGVSVRLSGWGTTSYPGSIPNDLQHISLVTTTVEQCAASHSIPVIESEICTLTKSGEGACHGDSGGPLVQVDEDGNIVSQAGIVSWGRPCAVGYPDVFTRVASFRSWIDSKIGN